MCPAAPITDPAGWQPVGSYDARTGMVVLPDGKRYTIGPVRADGSMTAVIALLLALMRS